MGRVDRILCLELTSSYFIYVYICLYMFIYMFVVSSVFIQLTLSEVHCYHFFTAPNGMFDNLERPLAMDIMDILLCIT
jgi:hypothetical protein